MTRCGAVRGIDLDVADGKIAGHVGLDGAGVAAVLLTAAIAFGRAVFALVSS